MGDAQITLYKNSVILRVFNKLSTRCLEFNEDWTLKQIMNTRLVIRQRADLFKANISASKIRARATLKGNTKTASSLVASQKTEFSDVTVQSRTQSLLASADQKARRLWVTLGTRL